MKHIAVICNNRNEWRHFVETLQFTLSKENRRYKAVAEAIVDIDKQVKYLYVTNHQSGIQKMRGYIVNNYITMARFVDMDVHEYLMAYIRGE